MSDEREMLNEIADQLDRWADESARGGWSTHQVGAQRREADRIRRFLARTRPAQSRVNPWGPTNHPPI